MCVYISNTCYYIDVDDDVYADVCVYVNAGVYADMYDCEVVYVDVDMDMSVYVTVYGDCYVVCNGYVDVGVYVYGWG